METVNGYAVPFPVDQHSVDEFNRGMLEWCNGIQDCCCGVDCENCIYCVTIDQDAYPKEYAFANYARSRGFKITRKDYEMLNKMPVLKGGMLIQQYSYYLLLVDGAHGYVVKSISDCKVELDVYRDVQIDHISAVYDLSSSVSPSTAIYSIVSGSESIMDSYRIWDKRPLREMTVEEIEKELGYKVKVIGNDCC